MSMTKRITRMLGIAAAICVLPMAFTSCDKEGLSHGSKAVRFKVSSKSNIETRTSYSGVITSGKERIDWTVGDKITVWSDNAVVTSGTANFSDYEITSVRADGFISWATIKNSGANGLSFRDDGRTQFWSVYPSSVSVNKVDGMAVTNPGTGAIGFTAVMDHEQELELNTVTNKYEPKRFKYNAFMTAYESGTYSDENEIELTFSPAFTAYEVHLKCAEGIDSEVTMKSFIINNSAVASPHKISAVCENGTWKYSVDYPRNLKGTFPANVVVPAYSATKELVFTVLAIPVSNPNPANMSAPEPMITFEYKVGDADYTKSLTLTDVTFAACKKHKLTGLLLPANEWKIFFAEEGMEVKEWVTGDDQIIVVE